MMFFMLVLQFQDFISLLNYQCSIVLHSAYTAGAVLSVPDVLGDEGEGVAPWGWCRRSAVEGSVSHTLVFSDIILPNTQAFLTDLLEWEDI